jgi:CO/xanthine dehydrogenase FAD-binding subunit
MEDLKWYFPTSAGEAAGLLHEGAAAHSGGTYLLRGRIQSLTKIVDLSGVPELKTISLNTGHGEREGEIISLGATATFAETVKYLTENAPGHLLAAALSRAAATPLRNRITLGGSIAAFPIWSDLIGPLLALNARVELRGDKIEVHTIEEYLGERALREGSLISRILVPAFPGKSWYYREVRTAFDYPFYTIALLERPGGDGTVKGVVTGCKGKFTVLDNLSDPEAAMKNVVFLDKRGATGEYLGHTALINLKRGLAAVREES